MRSPRFELGRDSDRLRLVALTTLAAAVVMAGCFDDQATRNMAKTFQSSGGRPDEPPVVLNKEQPFRYPAALYARKVQGNVTLHLYIDRDGAVHPESTRVEESSGFPSLDSAAIAGSQELRFVPAKLRGEAMPVSILFPVWFRHPEAPPLPGDTVLRGASSSGGAAPRPTP